MPTEVKKKLFTADEYHRMAEVGILPESRIELIDGEIIEMTAIGHRHWVCTNRANAFFVARFGDRALVSIQNSLQLSDWTEPQPDVVVFKPRPDFYAERRATPGDVLFLVEISDTSLPYDKKIKLPRYAAAGVPEVWIEDLQHELFLVYRNPDVDRYTLTLTLRAADSISPLAFPDVVFLVSDLLG